MGGHNLKDATGRYQRLTVTSRAEDRVYSSGKRTAMWNCVCDCGQPVVVSGGDLRRGHSTQCAACSRSARRKNLLGKIVGTFRIVRTVSGHWECECTTCRSTCLRKNPTPSSVCSICRSQSLARVRAEKKRLRAEDVSRRTVTRSGVCVVCGSEFEYTMVEGGNLKVHCSERCKRRRKRARTRQRTRARRAGVVIGTVDSYAVFERDNWVCQFCGVEAPRHLRGTRHSLAPELDHTVPLARGGPHSLENTRCIHRVCNDAKHVCVDRTTSPPC